MKIKQMMLAGIVCLIIPAHAMAALVFQEIVTVSGYNDVYNFSFTADIEATKYILTVTDLSTPPDVVAVNPRTAWTDSIEPAHALFGFDPWSSRPLWVLPTAVIFLPTVSVHKMTWEALCSGLKRFLFHHHYCCWEAVSWL